MAKKCSECRSFNPDAAAFCNQCGSRFPGVPGLPRLKPERAPRALSGLSAFLIFLTVIFAGALAVTLILLFHPDTPERRLLEGIAGDRGPVPGRGDSRRRGGAAAMEDPQGAAASAPKPTQAIPLVRLKHLAESAIAELELFDEDGESLRRDHAVLLEPAGILLARFYPLLGADHGVCRIRGRREAAEIAGAVEIDLARNLALLEIREPGDRSGGARPSFADPLPALAPLTSDGIAALEPELEVLVVSAEPGDIGSGGSWSVARMLRYPYLSADGVSRVQLADPGEAVASPFLAVDPFGDVIGLCNVGENGIFKLASEVLVDPLGLLELRLGMPVKYTLAQLTASYFEGTFESFLSRARKASRRGKSKEACEHLLRALEQAPREGIEAARQEEAREFLRQELADLRAELARRGEWREAARILERAIAQLERDRDLWLELAGAYLKLGRFQEAAESAQRARTLQPGSDADGLLQNSFLKLASGSVSAGDLKTAAQILQEGIGLLPASAPLHLELAKIYRQWEFFEDAIREFQVARHLDPILQSEVDIFLERIEEDIKRRESVIIPSPDDASIQTSAVVNGTLSFQFIIDTGATLTAISSAMAQALGYRFDGANQRWVRVRTANGAIDVPLVELNSVTVQGFTVQGLSAVVLPNNVANTGLLGLNFLRHFKYTHDSGRKEFRLERR